MIGVADPQQRIDELVRELAGEMAGGRLEQRVGRSEGERANRGRSTRLRRGGDNQDPGAVAGSEDFRQMANVALDDFNIWSIGKPFRQSANEVRVSLYRQDPAIRACLFDNHLSDWPGTGSKFQNCVGMGPVDVGHSRK